MVFGIQKRPGRDDRAFCICRLLLRFPLPCPDPDLFSPGLDCEKKPGGTFPAGMRRMLLENIRRDINAPELLEHPVFAAALKKLEESV